jgi:hypothetical protein
MLPVPAPDVLSLYLLGYLLMSGVAEKTRNASGAIRFELVSADSGEAYTRLAPFGLITVTCPSNVVQGTRQEWERRVPCGQWLALLARA